MPISFTKQSLILPGLPGFVLFTGKGSRVMSDTRLSYKDTIRSLAT